MTLISTAAKSARDLAQPDLLGQALGVQFQPYPPTVGTGNGSPTSQQVAAVAVYGTAGASVAGVKVRNGNAAAGTLPALARFGVTDVTGKVLAVSGNVNALANWGAGVLAFAFTAPVVLPYSGVYYPCFVVSGTFGTTQPVLMLNGPGSARMAADGANPLPAAGLNAQADLPAVGAAIAFVALGSAYWLALY